MVINRKLKIFNTKVYLGVCFRSLRSVQKAKKKVPFLAFMFCTFTISDVLVLNMQSTLIENLENVETWKEAMNSSPQRHRLRPIFLASF